MKKFVFCLGAFISFVLSSCGGSDGGFIGLEYLSTGITNTPSPIYTIQINPSSGNYSVNSPITFTVTITKNGSNFTFDNREVIISVFKEDSVGEIYTSFYGGAVHGTGGYTGQYYSDLTFSIKSGRGVFGITATYKGVSTTAKYNIN